MKSLHGPVSNCVTSTKGVSPMSERISGGLLCAMAGAGELWLIKSIRSMARLCATIPTGCLPEIVGAQESEPRRNLMRSGDRPLCKSKSSESSSAATRQTVLSCFHRDADQDQREL